jgi:formylglycine-generating enzyme required for sulfatase activity
MLGNAWEWMADCWNESYRGAPEDGSAWTVGECEKRVTRGGDWFNVPWVLRSATRTHTHPGKQSTDNYVGFRVAKTLP